MSPLSLQYRLNRRLVTGIAALVVIFVASLGTLLVRDQSREFDRALESKAHALLDLTQGRVTRIDLTDGRLLELENGRRPTFFAIRSAGRRVPEVSHHETPLVVSTNGRAVDTPRFTNMTLPDGTGGRQVEIDFAPVRSTVGPTTETEMATVVVAEPRVALLWKAAKASLTLLGFGALLLLALALLVRNALRRGLEPVIGLRRQMETLDPQHRGQRVNLQAPPDELAPIMRHINDLLERTEMSLRAKRTAAR